MSSSRRNSRNSSNLLGVCPVCGAEKVRLVTEAFSIGTGRTRRRIENISHEKCESCGERIFGLEASKALDLIILGKKRRFAA